MQLAFSSFTVDDALRNLDLDLHPDGITVFYDEEDKWAEKLLRCLIGLDPWQEGQIYLDGKLWDQYISEHSLIKTFTYVFDDGTMMSNLSLKENLYLPYQLRWEGDDLHRFEEELASLTARFGIDIDLRIRPALIRPAERKMLCFIQALMLKSTVLLINNPLYLLNHKQRDLLISVLMEYASQQPMIIASYDSELSRGFADRTVFIHSTDTGLSVKIQQNLDT